jgi:hypothetical protein
MADDDSAGHQHHGGGHTAEDKSQKPKTGTVGGHDYDLELLLLHMRRASRAKGSIQFRKK